MACLVVPLYDAVNVTGVLVATTEVVMVKVAWLAPAATRTDDGAVVIEVLLLLKLTVTPPAGALPFSLTVPVEGLPPASVAGLSVSELITTGSSVRTACLVTPL